ncbi:MAG TPA: hypothetical protein VN948_21485 [Terriglobales bacterium]|nr:hypothetical protein [Terriglobales bacterium]
MKSDHLPSLWYLATIFLLLWLTPPFALAQRQSGSDASSGETNQSWTATTQQQLPGTVNPTRTSETHTEAGSRTVDNQSTEHMGMYGRYEPYLDVQKETVKVDATTIRTVERRFGRDSDGRKTLVQVTEEEKRSLPGGEVKVVRTTSNPDANGGLQIVQREIQDTRQTSPDVQETKTTLLTPTPNGGLAASVQAEERQTKTSDHNVEFRKSTLLPDLNGNWQLSEVREGTVKDDGKDRTKEERVLRPGTDGNLSVVERTVSKESENSAGEKRDTVETYSTNLPGSAVDGSLHLNQRVTTVRRKGEDGTQSTEKQVEQRNPAQPSDSLRVTQQAIDIVRPGLGATSRETQTIRSLVSNGSLGVVSVDTRKKDNAPAIQVDIAPAKPPKAGPGH